MNKSFRKFVSLLLCMAILAPVISVVFPIYAENTDPLAEKAQALEAAMAEFAEAVPTIKYYSNYDIGNIKAITYTGASIDGSPTKVFAYLGYPENMEEGKKYPAVVLVHGGGGHAFSDWVKKWNDNGYIAIALDNTGYFPNSQGKFIWGLNGSDFYEDGYTNAPDNDNYGNISGDLDKQWIYHSVAQSILAKGVLEADSAVDTSKIGIYGISWGSVITNTVIGFEKFAFAVSQYIASHFELSQRFAQYAMHEGYKELWKADSRYDRVDFPVLFEQYSTDFSSSIKATTKCYEDLMSAGSILALRTNWVHTHDWDTPIEIYRFADSITKGGKPLTTFATQPDDSGIINCKLNVPDDAENVTARVQYITEKLTYTNSTSGWNADQYFMSSELEVKDGVITGTVPENAVEFYVEVTTEIGGKTYYTASKFLTVDKEYNFSMSESKSTSMIADFENGENPFPVVDNVYSNATHYTTDSKYLDFSTSEEALNGKSSLKVNIPQGNSRTEIVFSSGLNSSQRPVNKYMTCNENAVGMLLRLKINNDTTSTGHKFYVSNSQSGKKNNFLSDGAKLYDLQGNLISTLTGARACTIPSSFDGFIYLPFSTSHADCDCDGNRIYDNFAENPECMVDYTKNFNITITFGSLSGDTTWANTQVLVDDICIVEGEDGNVWNSMRECGYSIYNVAQPDKYTMPLDAENLYNPLGNITAWTAVNEYASTTVKYSGGATTVTNKVGEVLSGCASLKLDFDISKHTTDNVSIKRIKSDYFTVEGIEKLSAEKLKATASNDYAYFKARVQVPSDGNYYNLWFLIEQGNYFASFGNYGFAINSNGTENKDVTFAHNAPVVVPSGFDGYIFLPVYRMNAMPNRCMFSGYGVYTYANSTVKIDLSKDFKMAFAFSSNTTDLNKATFYLDDIGFVYGGKGDNNPTFTFDRELDTMPQAAQYKSGNYSIKNISRVTGKNALNGDGSAKIDIVGDENTNFFYNAAVFSGLSGISENSDIDGVMFRIKLLNDSTPLSLNRKEHSMYLAVSNSSTVLDCVYANNIMLFDKNGAPVAKNQYSANHIDLSLPVGFDGYIFFPLDAESRVNRLDHTKGATADITKKFNIELWFVYTKNWSGVDVLIDDVSYYTVSDNEVGLTQADAISKIKSLGYAADWTSQPDIYDLNANFENGKYPFYHMISYWSNGSSYPTHKDAAQILKDNNGNTSLKYSIGKSGGLKFARAESNISKFSGIKGLDKETITGKPAEYAYLTLRITVPTGNASTYPFNIYATQTGVGYPTRLKATHGYTVDGKYVAISASDGVSLLPAGFDGTIYMPIKSSTALAIMQTGGRPTYGKVGTTSDGQKEYGNDYMVDFSKDFSLQLYLQGNAWGNTDLTIDDLNLRKLHIADFDCNGEVNSKDITTLKKYLLGIETTDYICSINDDTNIDILDFISIKQAIAK